MSDVTKAAVFLNAGLLETEAWDFVVLALPLTALGTWTGWTLNRRLSERAYAGLFWAVMVGYAVRLAAA